MSDESDFDLQGFLPYLLNQAAESSGLAFQQVYKRRYGMLRTDWRVLFHLGMYGAMTAREIGMRGQIHKTKISRAVRRLSERRLLTRTRVEDDRRHEVLDLTPAGQSAFRELRDVAARYDAELVSRLGGDAEALRAALRRLAGFEPAD